MNYEKEYNKVCDKYIPRIQELEAENKSLKEVIERLHKEIEEQDKEYCKLKKENQTLELWLDNKEKLNEEYRTKLDKYKHYYDRDKEELMESCYALAKENDELKDTNKNLKSDLAYSRTLLDNVSAEYKSQVEINKKLKENIETLS